MERLIAKKIDKYRKITANKKLPYQLAKIINEAKKGL